MPDTAVAGFADEAARLLQEITREFLKRQAKEIAQGSISFPQLLILDALENKPLARMGELARYLSVSTAAATGIADTLVRHGFVIRGSSPRDRRIVTLALTAKGRNTLSRYKKTRQKAFVEIFGRLSGRDRSAYLEILKKIHGHLYEKKREKNAPG